MMCIKLLFFLTIFSITKSSQQSCKTADDESGFCVPIWLCNPIIRIIEDTPKPLPKRIQNYLFQSMCDTRAQSEICCSLKDTDSSNSDIPISKEDTARGAKLFHFFINSNDDKRRA